VREPPTTATQLALERQRPPQDLGGQTKRYFKLQRVVPRRRSAAVRRPPTVLESALSPITAQTSPFGSRRSPRLAHPRGHARGCQRPRRRGPRPRRLELREAPPPKSPVEERQPLGASHLRRTPLLDLIGSPPAIRRVRSVPVVERDEVAAVPVDLPEAPQQPHVGVLKQCLVQRPKQQLDPPVRPRMRRPDQHVPSPMALEHRLENRRT
jgi:hypothetical protein